jgi:hypothetical protein
VAGASRSCTKIQTAQRNFLRVSENSSHSLSRTARAGTPRGAKWRNGVERHSSRVAGTRRGAMEREQPFSLLHEPKPRSAISPRPPEAPITPDILSIPLPTSTLRELRILHGKSAPLCPTFSPLVLNSPSLTPITVQPRGTSVSLRRNPVLPLRNLVSPGRNRVLQARNRCFMPRNPLSLPRTLFRSPGTLSRSRRTLFRPRRTLSRTRRTVFHPRRTLSRRFPSPFRRHGTAFRRFGTTSCHHRTVSRHLRPRARRLPTPAHRPTAYCQ